jgi:ATP-dependent Clp protease ATP-binding subunit ClpA
MSRYDRYEPDALAILIAAQKLVAAEEREECCILDLARAALSAAPAAMGAILNSEGLSPDSAAIAGIRSRLDRAMDPDKPIRLSTDLRSALEAAETAAGSGRVDASKLVQAAWPMMKPLLGSLVVAKAASQAVPADGPTQAPGQASPQQGSAAAPVLSPEDARFLAEYGREMGPSNCAEAYGRDAEMDTILSILLKVFKPNPLLIGDPGVGKTAIVEGLALRFLEGRVPEKLKGYRIFELRLGDLNAGTQFKGSFEERIKRIFDLAERSGKIIFFIDEIHLLGDERFTQELGNLLKPPLARGLFPVIGATTQEDYYRYLNHSEALTRRFQTVEVKEPDAEKTGLILERLRPRFESHHRLSVAPDLTAMAIELAGSFIHQRFFPDKAIDLMDRACSKAALAGAPSLAADHLYAALSDVIGVRVTRESACLDASLSGLEKELSAVIKGQDQAIQGVGATIRLCKRRLDLRTERPDGVFLFAGPSGCGKTALAEALAKAVSGKRDALYRIDMSEYADGYSASRLVGSPPGFVGYSERPALDVAADKAAGGVVLLDEFEKASLAVQRIFLQVFDEGRATLATGKPVDFSHTTFVATCNVLAKPEAAVGFAVSSAARAERGPMLAAVEKLFTPEILGRFDEIIPFRRLELADCEQILREVIGPEAAARLKEEYGIGLSLDDDAAAFIAERGYSEELGARNLNKAFQDLVLKPINEGLPGNQGKSLRARLRDGSVIIESGG